MIGSSDLRTPGVYQRTLVLARPDVLQTAVPAFLGYAAQAPTESADAPPALVGWSDFGHYFGAPLPDSYLGPAVRAFFENGGQRCFVVRLDDARPPLDALEVGLAALDDLDAIDLVCAPDIMRPTEGVTPPASMTTPLEKRYSDAAVSAMQRAVLRHCEKLGDRLAILDSLPGAGPDDVLAQRQYLTGLDGALYYPWLRLAAPVTRASVVPPCGHVAGVYARADRQAGPHKAPANEPLEGVLDLEVAVDDAIQGRLNPYGVNCVRAFPGRGIRVWGARTLAPDQDQEPAYVSTRRVILTAVRWLRRNTASAAFEPSDARLWARLEREVTAYCDSLYRRGALSGGTPEAAYYVKCDEDLNPTEVRDAGLVVTEIGLAPARPREFVVVRIVHSASGMAVDGLARTL
jgi:hypothetical protein